MAAIVTATMLLIFTVAPAHADNALTTREEAENWFGKNVVTGMSCTDLLSLHSENVQVAAVGEDMSNRDSGPAFVTWWMDVTAQYGTDKMCPLQKRAHCSGEGKVEGVEDIPRECP